MIGDGYDPAALSVRADEGRLPPFDPALGLRWTRLLSAEAAGATWRLLEVSAASPTPFALKLAWTAGHGASVGARMTVSTATRIAVFARHLEVQGAALGPEARVAVHVADGHAPTRNVWVASAGPAGVAVPPFAHSVRADLPDGARAQDAFVVLRDPSGDPLAEVRLDRQPSGGLPLAGATAVAVRNARTARLTFSLHL
ncbi:MAG: hypothetical protein AB8H79_23665 [Myxococcota bacterium]